MSVKYQEMAAVRKANQKARGAVLHARQEKQRVADRAQRAKGWTERHAKAAKKEQGT